VPTDARTPGKGCWHVQVRCAWLLLCMRAEDEAALQDALAFAKEQGRMKYVRPLYKALFQSKMGKQPALQQFREVRSMYHPICEKLVASDLKV
jgi:leukotriene-A4 hydrolase